MLEHTHTRTYTHTYMHTYMCTHAHVLMHITVIQILMEAQTGELLEFGSFQSSQENTNAMIQPETLPLKKLVEEDTQAPL